MCYDPTLETLWNVLDNWEYIAIQKGMVIIDLNV